MSPLRPASVLACLLLVGLPSPALAHEGEAHFECGPSEEPGVAVACTGRIFVGALGLAVEHRRAQAPSPADVDTRDALGGDGVTAVTFPLPEGTAGEAFRLRATAGNRGALGPPDFDVDFLDASGARIATFQAAGDEVGVAPAGAASARVLLYDGRAGYFAFESLR